MAFFITKWGCLMYIVRVLNTCMHEVKTFESIKLYDKAGTKKKCLFF